MSAVSGTIDRFAAHEVAGWAWAPAEPAAAVEVRALIGGRVVAVGFAAEPRPDVQAAGFGTGRYGFRLPLPQGAVAEARRSGAVFELRAGPTPGHTVFRETLRPADALPDLARELAVEAVRRLRARRRTEPAGATPSTAQPPLYRRLVETPPGRSVAPFADHVRLRHGLAATFEPDVFVGDRDRYLTWYLEEYAARQRPRRAPLGADDLAYMSEPVALGRGAFVVPRVTLWCALEDPAARELLGRPDDPVAHRDLCYWWVAERAPRLGVEDCLVTDAQAALLAEVTGERDDVAAPCRFLEAALAARPDLAAVRRSARTGTALPVYLLLLLEGALENPAILRCLPPGLLDHLFEGPAPAFDALLAACGRDAVLDRAAYAAALAERGFDVAARRFRTRDADGHRVEAARAGVTASAAGSCDVQVIGALSRSSGLGRVARTSLDLLAPTGLRLNALDFAIDNPQPRESGARAFGDPPRAARVNLVHLNPDLLPLAVAYLPDVFTGARNIGFAFWELDRVSEAMRLGLELVDEVWVASEYNRRCFAAATDKPVVNVGAALTGWPAVESAGAAAALRQRFGFRPDDFVYFASYDSFSYPQRKNPLGLLRAFEDAFSEGEAVRLLVKTHNATSLDEPYRRKVWQTLQAAAERDPRVVLVNETMDYAALMRLKAGADCYVSLHRSEGLGLGMLEAMRLGLPVVCTGYGGNADFCRADTAWLVAFDEVFVAERDYAYAEPGQRWAAPRHASAVEQLRAVRQDAEARRARSAAAQALVVAEYGEAAGRRRYLDRLKALGIG